MTGLNPAYKIPGAKKKTLIILKKADANLKYPLTPLTLSYLFFLFFNVFHAWYFSLRNRSFFFGLRRLWIFWLLHLYLRVAPKPRNLQQKDGKRGRQLVNNELITTLQESRSTFWGLGAPELSVNPPGKRAWLSLRLVGTAKPRKLNNGLGSRARPFPRVDLGQRLQVLLEY